MKFRGYFLCCLFISALICGCDDKNSSEAEDYEIKKAFREGDCDYVVEKLEPRKDIFSDEEKYMYNNSVLACSGFSITDNLGDIFDKSSNKTPFEMIQNLMGKDKQLTATKIDELSTRYEKILNNCKDPDRLDDKTKTVCGITAAADTVLAVSKVALEFLPDPGEGKEKTIPTTVEGIKKAVEGQSEEQIIEKVKSAEVDIPRLSNNIELIMDTSKVISDQANVSFSDDLEVFYTDMKGGNPNGSFTADTLSKYIEDKFARSAQ